MKVSDIKEKLRKLDARLIAYQEAEAAILRSQSYSIEGLTLTRANLTEVRRAIMNIEAEIDSLSRKLLRLKKYRVVMPGW